MRKGVSSAQSVSSDSPSVFFFLFFLNAFFARRVYKVYLARFDADLEVYLGCIFFVQKVYLAIFDAELVDSERIRDLLAVLICLTNLNLLLCIFRRFFQVKKFFPPR